MDCTEITELSKVSLPSNCGIVSVETINGITLKAQPSHIIFIPYHSLSKNQIIQINLSLKDV